VFDVTDPVEREHAMANREATPARHDWKAVLTSDEDGFRALLQTVVQEVLEAEMTEALQAEKDERTPGRLGHRSGYYERKLVTRIGVNPSSGVAAAQSRSVTSTSNPLAARKYVRMRRSAGPLLLTTAPW
jgi:hypothetical protein